MKYPYIGFLFVIFVCITTVPTFGAVSVCSVSTTYSPVYLESEKAISDEIPYCGSETVQRANTYTVEVPPNHSLEWVSVFNLTDDVDLFINKGDSVGYELDSNNNCLNCKRFSGGYNKSSEFIRLRDSDEKYNGSQYTDVWSVMVYNYSEKKSGVGYTIEVKIKDNTFPKYFGYEAIIEKFHEGYPAFFGSVRGFLKEKYGFTWRMYYLDSAQKILTGGIAVEHDTNEVRWYSLSGSQWYKAKEKLPPGYPKTE